ncbi:MAG: helix-turn-helix transcriptional regulator [Clostridia bacterium]|nr:helix-turn-helix transcriptional regulator [Clostridia bacterium]
MTSNIAKNFESFYFHHTKNKTCSNSTEHNHLGIEIYYMREGKCHYFINDKSYDIISGDIILVPKGALHGTSYGSKPCTRLLINFDDSIISKEVLEGIRNIEYLYRNPQTISNIDRIFDAIESEYLRADSLSGAALTSITEALLIFIIRNQQHKSVHENNTIVQSAVKYIQDNYMSTIRLAEVAKMLSVSEEHLSRTFKKEITFGFSEYVTLIRLQKAEHMLKNEPSRAITEVAYACGFNDSNYFSYKFKKAYGVTPTEVRDGALNSKHIPD